MILGIFPNLGDSFAAYKKSGRDTHWENNYLCYYSQNFEKIFFFSYKNEENPFPGRLDFLPNRYDLPRFLYTFLIPFIYSRELQTCHVLRVRQITGVWPALIAKLLWRKPILSTYGYDYSLFAQKTKSMIFIPLIKITELIGLWFSDMVMVTNTEIYKKIIKIINKNKIVLIPNGVDISKFKIPASVRHSRTSAGRQNSKIIKINILSVGRLVKQKNFSSLIKAAGLIRKDYRIKLTIVGWGPLERELKSLAEKLKVNLEIIERKSYYEMPKIYQQADIFVLPSFYEGSPKVLLEAMACGLPCVVNDKKYSRFIIKNGVNGLLTKAEPGQLAKSIEILINNKELTEKISANARETIIKDFNNQKMLEREISMLKKLIHQ